MDNAIGDMGQDKQPATHNNSRGLVLELTHKDGEPFVAKMLKQYQRPDGKYGDRRGNLQILPNGNVLMAWTDAGYISEHTDDDKVLMEAKWLKSGRFGTYRAYKYNDWVGQPDRIPDVKALGYGNEGGIGNTVAIYVSWNGATEVRKWRFTANGKVLDTVDESGFETVFAAKDVSGWIQAEALDSEGKSLQRSLEVEIEWVTSVKLSNGSDKRASKKFAIAVVVLSIASGIVIGLCFMWFVRRDMRARKAREEAHLYKEVPLDEQAQT